MLKYLTVRSVLYILTPEFNVNPLFSLLQMATQESIAERLRGELASRDSELCKLRDQGNSLTVAVADLRKQLTVKEQELQLAKREAKNTLRYMCSLAVCKCVDTCIIIPMILHLVKLKLRVYRQTNVIYTPAIPRSTSTSVFNTHLC